MNIHHDIKNKSISTYLTKRMETSNTILNFRSNHPKHQILNTVKNYIYKAINCTDKIHLNTIKKQIYQNLIENFYPKDLINYFWYCHLKIE